MASVMTVAPHQPRPPFVSGYLDDLLARFADDDGGEVATYIPELARSTPTFGICLATADGALYEAGDTRAPFTIQSISKPLSTGSRSSTCGRSAVSAKVGVEPSGEAFNAISLEPERAARVNPMINAGAIADAALVAGDGRRPVRRCASGRLLALAGRRLASTRASTAPSARPGTATARSRTCCATSASSATTPRPALDLYFRQCSISVDCRDLALMAATLANGGVNPRTGERVAARSRPRAERAERDGHLRDVRLRRRMARPRRHAGEERRRRRGPRGAARSPRHGRLLAAARRPRQQRPGHRVCRELSRGLALHLVRPGERHAPVIRASSTIAERPSKRVRLRGQRLALDQHAARTAVFELQGELGFAAVEAVSRKLTTDGDRAELVVLDLRRILRADPSGFGLLAALGRQLERRGGRLAVAGAPELSSAPEEGIACSFDDLDRALEWCEEELLGELGQGAEGDGISIEHHELLSGLTGDEVAELDRELGFVSAAPHDLLAQAGEPAHELLLVTRGTLSVYSAAEGPSAG